MFQGVACRFWLFRGVWEKLWESCSGWTRFFPADAARFEPAAYASGDHFTGDFGCASRGRLSRNPSDADTRRHQRRRYVAIEVWPFKKPASSARLPR
jgi:hypothetical protein